MQQLVEGRLTFSFPAPLSAQQYDNWSFYRNQFNDAFGGTKAVDFICLDQDCAWLIEVKDYRANLRTKPSDLGDEIARKVRDSLAGLVSASCNANDAGERQFAKQFTRMQRLRVVAHIEQPRRPSRLHPRVIDPANFKMKLKQLLRAVDPHPLVVDQNSRLPDIRWNVEG
jgi:hypothetical protein